MPVKGAAAASERGEPQRRGRPRSEEADHAILAAATQLLADRGLTGMSIEEVAARAGVGKATIYRRWPTRGALALDAFLAEFSSQLPMPDTGSLRRDLRESLTAWVRAVTTTRAGRMLAGLIAEAQRDPALGTAWLERVMEPLREQHRAMVRQAIERGEVPPGTDQDVVLDLLFGAAYHRLLHRHLPLTSKFVRQVVDLIMDGVAGTKEQGLSDPGPRVGSPARSRSGPAPGRGRQSRPRGAGDTGTGQDDTTTQRRGHDRSPDHPDR